MVIMMNEFGRCLTTREAGREAYTTIKDAMSSTSGKIAFDFSGVDMITNSFADEVFGRLVAEMGFDRFKSRSTFASISGLWAKVVRVAMDSRAAQLA